MSQSVSQTQSRINRAAGQHKRHIRMLAHSAKERISAQANTVQDHVRLHILAIFFVAGLKK